MARANAQASGIVGLGRAGDELTGDLEAVDGEPPQVGERRVARPEVVHGDPDAEVAKRLERRDGRPDIPEHRGLGHLEGQVVRVDARRRAISATTSSMKPGCWSWSGERLTLSWSASQARQAMPIDDLPGGRLEDRPAEGEDRAVLLGHPDELGRIDRAARRVVPADQRLDADDPAAGEHDDRLVGDGQVAAADASAEIRRQRVAFDDRAVHRRIEDLRAALAVGLGAVHRDVGVAQDLVDRGARPGRG